MGNIKFDFNNMFASSIGKTNGITTDELVAMKSHAADCVRHIMKVRSSPKERSDLGLEWMMLPYQDRSSTERIQSMGNQIASSYENVVFLGIGGSYLGLKAAQDALRMPYYNEFEQIRKGRPRIYFEGNNLDPDKIGRAHV